MNVTLTDEEVDTLFAQDIAPVETWINKNCIWNPPIKQCEFDTLCSFLHQYNIHNIAYATTKAAIIAGDREKIITQLLQFRNSKAGSGDNRQIPHRQREIAMFKMGY